MYMLLDGLKSESKSSPFNSVKYKSLCIVIEYKIYYLFHFIKLIKIEKITHALSNL